MALHKRWCLRSADALRRPTPLLELHVQSNAANGSRVSDRSRFRLEDLEVRREVHSRGELDVVEEFDAVQILTTFRTFVRGYPF